MFFSIFIPLSLISIGLLAYYMLCKQESPLTTKVMKVVCVVWMSLYFLKIFLPDGFVLRSFDDIEIYKSGKGIPFAIFRWIREASFVILPIAIFLKKPLFSKFAAYGVVAISLLNIGLYSVQIAHFTDPNGQGIMTLRFFSAETKAFFVNRTFRAIVFGVMAYLELMLAVSVALRDRKVLTINKDIKSVLKNVGIFFLIVLALIPIFVPQYLTKGYSMTTDKNIDNFKMGTFFHFVWIAMVIVEGVVLSLVFRKKSYQDRYILVLILGFALLLQYNTMFTCVGEITAHRMPFQLCNMAGFFIIAMLIKRSEKIYHFTLIINSVGALIAMVLCDTTPYGVSYVMNAHYILEHTNVILVPLLCATLGIFKPLKTRDIKDFVLGFTAYFLFVLLIGGIFTGLKDKYATIDPNVSSYWNCNYLYMFNKEESTSIIGFVGPLFDANFKLFNFFTLSLVQPVIYAVFLAICSGAFFLLKFLFRKNTLWEQTNEHTIVSE